jgi:hypothetical protein
MEDGCKFCTQNMLHLSEPMLNLFVVSVNCHYYECVYYEFVSLIKIIVGNNKKQ